MLRLECTIGKHFKFYEFDIVQENGQWVAKGFWGRIGNAPQVSILYAGLSLVAAQRAVETKRDKEIAKGYRVTSGTLPCGTPTGKSISALLKKNQKVQKVQKQRVQFRAPKEESSIETIWAMNALGITESELDSFLTNEDYVMQEKFDGMRAIVHITDNGLRIFSRNAGVGDPTKPLEKTQALPYFAKIQFPELVGTVLDAEIMGTGTAAEVAGAVHRNGGTDSGGTSLYIFDILYIRGRDLRDECLNVRLTELDSIASTLRVEEQWSSRWMRIWFPPYYHSHSDKKRILDEVFDRGGEGVMFKNLEGVYVSGDRPADNWYKYKKHKKFDCVVMGFTNGKGKYVGAIGAVIFGQYKNGKLVELGQASGMNDAVRKDMSDNQQKWIGKAIVIEGQERLKSGAIRHPRYRGESGKLSKDCVWYQNEQ